MNFLSLRRVAPWLFSLAAVGCGSGSGDLAPPLDAGTLVADAGSAQDSAGVLADLAPPPTCTSNGTSRLRVALGLDPGLEARGPEVWLVVRCGSVGGVERVLRWDRTATQTIDALGPGSYEVTGSSFMAPWSSSTRVMLADGATAAVSVTLPSGPPVLAQVRSGVYGDPTVWRASVPLVSGGSTASVASMEVEVRPYVSDPPSTGDAFVSVTAVVRNPCATDQCAPYLLRALEIRTRAGDGPTGLQGFRFPDDERLAAGESKSVPQPMVVRGAMPDDSHGIELVLYGEVVRVEGAHP
jgi:hypothetical protein